MTEHKITPLQKILANQIVYWLKGEKALKNTKLAESTVAQRFNVSRTPVRAALTYLQQLGITQTLPYRGFALAMDASEIIGFDTQSKQDNEQESLYLQILKDLFFGKLSHTFSETELQTRYGASRTSIRQLLMQLEADSIVIRGLGYKWMVESTLNEVRSHLESYRFRLIFEPAALLEEDWLLDRSELESCKSRQLAAIAEPDSVTPRQLFDLSADFHELLVSCSGNRFLLGAMRQQNRLRRATDQVSMHLQTNVKKACGRRLTILELLLSGDNQEAAIKLKELLENDVRVMKRTYGSMET